MVGRFYAKTKELERGKEEEKNREEEKRRGECEGKHTRGGGRRIRRTGTNERCSVCTRRCVSGTFVLLEEIHVVVEGEGGAQLQRVGHAGMLPIFGGYHTCRKVLEK